MPPKRAAAGSSRAKKSRPSTDADGDGSAAATPPIPRGKRWNPDISGSANVDMEYKLDTQNPVTAYRFVCMCQPPFRNGDKYASDSDEAEDDNKENSAEGERSKKPTKPGKRPKCDGGDTCLCEKPASEHPDHIWKLSYAGKRKFFAQNIHCQLRCPDYFDMYTFNRHECYGMLEVLQNLILDFEEAAGNYKEQWAVCEALAFFLATDAPWSVTGVSNDGTVDDTMVIIGRLFMSMLATLEREGHLSKDSEIVNLGLIMALFMHFARTCRQCGMLERSNRQSLGPAKDKKKWTPHTFDNQILAYARKYDIDLVGPHKIGEIIAKANGNVDLPVSESNKTAKADPFGFARNLKKYKEERGGLSAWMALSSHCYTPIGGDSLDLTTWSSEKRKEKSFDDKDPLTEEHIKALKEGFVVMLAPAN